MPMPSKGDRRFLAGRLPVDLTDRFLALADERGATITDALLEAVERDVKRREAETREEVTVR